MDTCKKINASITTTFYYTLQLSHFWRDSSDFGQKFASVPLFTAFLGTNLSDDF